MYAGYLNWLFFPYSTNSTYCSSRIYVSKDKNCDHCYRSRLLPPENLDPDCVMNIKMLLTGPWRGYEKPSHVRFVLKINQSVINQLSTMNDLSFRACEIASKINTSHLSFFETTLEGCWNTQIKCVAFFLIFFLGLRVWLFPFPDQNSSSSNYNVFFFSNFLREHATLRYEGVRLFWPICVIGTSIPGVWIPGTMTWYRVKTGENTIKE